MEKFGYRFSFGPWNIHEGADPFGPTVRSAVLFDKKVEILKGLGYDAMQFHDDDVVPDLDKFTAAEISKQARAIRAKLSGTWPGRRVRRASLVGIADDCGWRLYCE